MARRKSIEIDSFRHANPIPNASRIGNLLMSGVFLGRDPETGEYPPSLAEQAALVFRFMRETVEAAGGTTDDILKVNIYLKDASDRAALNELWTGNVPRPGRPARASYPARRLGPGRRLHPVRLHRGDRLRGLVGPAGLEPALPVGKQILSLLCLPIPPRTHRPLAPGG